MEATKSKLYFTPLLIVSFSLIFLLINYLFNIRYETNDDSVMLLISSGKYTGQPNHHLVFINIILGYILKFFYEITNQLEWYTFLIIGLNIFSSAVITKNIIQSKINKFTKAVLVLFVIAIFTQFAFLLQFTKTSSLLAIAGFSCIVFSKQNWLGSSLLIIAALVRFEMALFMMIVLFPILILTNESILSILRSKTFKTFVITISVIFFLKGIDTIHYQLDPEWKSFKTYNDARGKINDHPYLQKSKINLPPNISQGDLKLLQYSTTDPNVWTLDQLKELNETVKDIDFSEKWKRTSNYFEEYEDYFYLLTIILVTLAIINKKNYIRFSTPLLTLILLLIYISLDATIKPRLIEPAFYGIIICLFLSAKNSDHKFINVSFILVLIGLLVKISANTLAISENSQTRKKLYYDQLSLINKYLEETSNNLVPFGPALHIEFENPFEVASNFPAGRLTFAGWMTNSPLNKGKFTSHKAFTTNYSLLIFSEAAQETQNLIANSLAKNYNLNVIPKLIFLESDLGIIEFPISKINPPD